jgi:hypothetical protein
MQKALINVRAILRSRHNIYDCIPTSKIFPSASPLAKITRKRVKRQFTLISVGERPQAAHLLRSWV